MLMLGERKGKAEKEEMVKGEETRVLEIDWMKRCLKGLVGEGLGKEGKGKQRVTGRDSLDGMEACAGDRMLW